MNINPGLHDAFGNEHRQTEQLLEGLKVLAKGHRWQEIREQVRLLFRELEHHINVEEEYVYPEVEHGIQDEDLLRTIAVLHKRHLEIPGYILEIEDNAGEQDERETLAAIELLERILLDHHHTEETSIFPLFARKGQLSTHAEAAVSALEEGYAQ